MVVNYSLFPLLGRLVSSLLHRMLALLLTWGHADRMNREASLFWPIIWSGDVSLVVGRLKRTVVEVRGWKEVHLPRLRAAIDAFLMGIGSGCMARIQQRYASKFARDPFKSAKQETHEPLIHFLFYKTKISAR